MGVQKPSKLLFHVDLSEEEKEYFGRLRIECKEWVDLVSDWDRKRKETCQEEGCVSQPMFQRQVFNLIRSRKVV